MKTIPSLDLLDYFDPNKKIKFVKDLGEAYENIGFVSIKNYGLSNDEEKKLYEKTKQFFELPNSTKKKYEKKELNGQRGFISFGRETAKGFKHHDLKEFWHFGQTLDDNDPLNKEYEPNIYCEEIPEFNEIGRHVFETLEKAGNTILNAIALHLNLEENYFTDKVYKGNSILRAIHYPPIKEDPGSSVRAAEHGDINLITLLMGASASGLEVKDRSGDWIAITAIPRHVVVNIGDMMSRLTNNVLHSSIHRVINPPKEEWNKPRFSIPFFMHPRSEMLLNCLPNCISSINPKKYDDITAGEFLKQRIKELRLNK
tara:strand:- start:3161 stop:4102 length:942 start_codon:yes stop_codon:yes gene_type:complete